MIFTSFDYLVFLALTVAVYWLVRNRSAQNAILLAGSYIFYGYIHPWFCILMAASTLVDYTAARAIERFPSRRKLFLVVSLSANLGLLGVFKYFNFFAAEIQSLLLQAGFQFHPVVFQIFLPVGISFYTFQTMSYTIEVYWGKLKARRNLPDFALFVSLFPQLVAGPIERASHLLPQIETPRRWDWAFIPEALGLLLRGYFKKLVIADNVSVFVDKVYMLETPSLLLLTAGTLGFAIQIYSDFSGYTDIARGSARLLGFDLMENFRAPYAAVSPSDFWRRWHISFSTWIRDYLYIPLGGSRVPNRRSYFAVLLVTMGLAGFWHGAAWHFIAWGLFHGLLLFIYHCLGLGGHWMPATRGKTVTAWFLMFCFTLIGWTLFRAPSLHWLGHAIRSTAFWSLSDDAITTGVAMLGIIALYGAGLWAILRFDRAVGQKPVLQAAYQGGLMIAILVLAAGSHQDFIYFQF